MSTSKAVSSYLQLLPDALQPFVSEITDVRPDGHCGFRAISVSLGQSEHKWATIRQDMISEINKHPLFYTDELMDTLQLGSVSTCISKLNTTLPNVVRTPEHWLQMFGMATIVANTYERPVFYATRSDKYGQELYLTLPFFSTPSSVAPIFIALFPSVRHYVSLQVDWKNPQFPSGKLCRIWVKRHLPVASGWSDYFPGAPILPDKVYTEEEREKIRVPLDLSDDDDA